MCEYLACRLTPKFRSVALQSFLGCLQSQELPCSLHHHKVNLGQASNFLQPISLVFTHCTPAHES